MSPAAANAFLKFLEEPPSYAVVILIAPSVESVLPTIVSRSVTVRFGAVDTAIDLPEPHPAARLGRVGELLEAAEHPDAYSAQLSIVHDYLLALPKGLEEAFERADALEKAWSEDARFSVSELLRARLSEWPGGAYAAGIAALQRCEAALAAYASPGVAVQVLTLELREILREKQAVINTPVKVGMNGRFFPDNWRPVTEETRFARGNGFSALQFQGKETGLAEEHIGASFAEARRALDSAQITATMEMLIRLQDDGRTAPGQTPLEVLEANLPAIQKLPCQHVHWHLTRARF